MVGNFHWKIRVGRYAWDGETSLVGGCCKSLKDKDFAFRMSSRVGL